MKRGPGGSSAAAAVALLSAADRTMGCLSDMKIDPSCTSYLGQEVSGSCLRQRSWGILVGGLRPPPWGTDRPLPVILGGEGNAGRGIMWGSGLC